MLDKRIIEGLKPEDKEKVYLFESFANEVLTEDTVRKYLDNKVKQGVLSDWEALNEKGKLTRLINHLKVATDEWLSYKINMMFTTYEK